jgi:soluble lytic murein transglycosylase-like protein
VRLAAVLPALVVATTASIARADGFEYVDRQGHQHVVRIAASDAHAPSDAQTPHEPASSPAGGRPQQDASFPVPSAALPFVGPATLFIPLAPAPSGTPGPEDDAFPYASFITEAAQLYALPRELVCAVMTVESAGNPLAVSASGAEGLMQLMPSTAADLQVTDAFDPRQNIFGGARFLRVLVNTFEGDLSLALAAYHAGAGRVQRSGGVPDIPATRRYIAKVLATYHRLARGGAEGSSPGPGREAAVSMTKPSLTDRALMALSARAGQ